MSGTAGIETLVLSVVALLGVAVSFFVSAAAGLGGSLVLVPVLALALGAREGVTLAAVLLAGNNLVKLWVYRSVLPLRPTVVLVACTGIGALFGARLLVAAPESIIGLAVVLACAASFAVEAVGLGPVTRSTAWVFACAAGAMSGFSGTSGPLKGIAVRSCGFDRLRTVGAATLLSATSDITKTAVFAEAGLFSSTTAWITAGAIPLMILATLAGRRFTQAIGERGYARLFWVVIAGYAVRLVLSR